MGIDDETRMSAPRNFGFSYGYNHNGTVQNNNLLRRLGLGFDLSEGFLAESSVPFPSDMIAIGDNSIDKQNAASVAQLLVHDIIGLPGRRRFLHTPGTRHSRGANVVFCDGHVEYAKQRIWLAGSETARKRWNNDNEPHPETW